MSIGLFKLDRELSQEGNIVATYLKINTELIRGGIISKLTPSQLKVLLVIAGHINEEGESFPSLVTIEKLTGLSRPTVVAAIKDLITIKIEGVSLMSKRYDGDNKRARNIYSFNTLDMAQEDIISTEKESLELTPKAVVLLFMKEYKDTFGVDYPVSWARDLAQVKRSLLPNFTDDEIKIIIKITVEEYKTRWSTPKFKTPTIGAMCKWISAQAIEIHKEREKRNQVSGYATPDNQESLERSKEIW